MQEAAYGAGRRADEAARIAIFAVAYSGMALVGRSTIIPEYGIGMVWPAAAVSVLWMTMRAGAPTRWIDVTLIGALASATVAATGGTAPLALSSGVAAIMQCVVCDLIIRRFCPRVWRSRGRAMIGSQEMWWLFAAAVAGPLLSSPLVELDPLLRGEVWRWDLMLLWFARNLSAIVVLVPLGLAVVSHAVRFGGLATAIASARRMVHSRPAEWIALIVLSPLVHVAWFVLVDDVPIVFPLLVLAGWAGARLPAELVALHNALVAFLVILCTASDEGPFVYTADPVMEVAVAHLYIVVAGGMALALSLGRDERVRLSDALERARDQARTQADLFGTIVDTMSEGVRVVNGEGAVIVRNPAATRLLLGSSARAGGQDGELPHGADLQSLRALDGTPLPVEAMPFCRSLAGEEVRDLALLVRTDDAERIVSFTTARLPERTGGGVVTVLRDVTLERQELMRAAQVQAGLLPTEPPRMPGYDLAARFVPAGSVGGDFYDWYEVDHGVVLTLADVMGKGAGAAILAATTRSLLRVHGADEDVVRPLALAERSMQRDLDAANAFVTVFRAFVHAPTGEVTYSDAGHGLAAIVAPNGGVRRLRANGLPLGIAPGEARVADRERLAPGEMLVVLSDGVLDALGGTLEALSGVWAAVRSGATAAEAVAGVVDLATAGNVDDDLTVLALRREA